MGPEMVAEVHFHSKEQASCLLATTWTGLDALRSEIVLLSFFAHRQIANLGREFGLSVGTMLAALRTPDFAGATICTSVGTIGPFEPAPALLSSHPGPASKRFVAKLANDSFKMHAKGFGFFGTKLLFYAPMALAVLTQFLAQRRRHDETFLSALGFLLANVGSAAERGAVSVGTQTRLSLAAAFDAIARAGLIAEDEGA